MDKNLIEKIKIKKEELLKDGFKIIAIFGSYARGEERIDSDIDILYDVTPKFVKKFKGFEAFSKLNEIRSELEKELNKKVDIATIDNSSKTFKEFVFKDAIYV